MVPLLEPQAVCPEKSLGRRLEQSREDDREMGFALRRTEASSEMAFENLYLRLMLRALWEIVLKTLRCTQKELSTLCTGSHRYVE